MKTIAFASLMFLFAAACSDPGLQVNVRFSNPEGLAAGSRIVAGDQIAGVVTNIEADDNGIHTARLIIKREMAAQVTDQTRFLIRTDPTEPGRTAVVPRQSGTPGKPLTNGAMVDATRQSTGFLDHLRDGLEKGLEALSERMQELTDEVKQFPQSDAFKELESELKVLGEKLIESSEKAKEKIRRDILPKLQEKLEELRRELEDLDRQNEIRALEEEIEKIKRL